MKYSKLKQALMIMTVLTGVMVVPISDVAKAIEVDNNLSNTQMSDKNITSSVKDDESTDSSSEVVEETAHNDENITSDTKTESENYNTKQIFSATKQTGYVKKGNDVYFYNPNGSLFKGLRKFGKVQFEFYGPNGIRYQNKTATVNGKIYFFGVDGQAVKGLHKSGKYLEYYNSNAEKMVNCTIKVGNATYHFNEKGYAITGAFTDSDKQLKYFGSDFKQINNKNATNAQMNTVVSKISGIADSRKSKLLGIRQYEQGSVIILAKTGSNGQIAYTEIYLNKNGVDVTFYFHLVKNGKAVNFQKFNCKLEVNNNKKQLIYIDPKTKVKKTTTLENGQANFAPLLIPIIAVGGELLVDAAAASITVLSAGLSISSQAGAIGYGGHLLYQGVKRAYGNPNITALSAQSNTNKDVKKVINTVTQEINSPVYYGYSGEAANFKAVQDANFNSFGKTFTNINSAINGMNKGISITNQELQTINQDIIRLNGTLSKMNKAVSMINTSISQMNSSMVKINTGLSQMNAGVIKLNNGTNNAIKNINQVVSAMAEMNKALAESNAAFNRVFNNKDHAANMKALDKAMNDLRNWKPAPIIFHGDEYTATHPYSDLDSDYFRKRITDFPVQMGRPTINVKNKKITFNVNSKVKTGEFSVYLRYKYPQDEQAPTFKSEKIIKITKIGNNNVVLDLPDTKKGIDKVYELVGEYSTKNFNSMFPDGYQSDVPYEIDFLNKSNGIIYDVSKGQTVKYKDKFVRTDINPIKVGDNVVISGKTTALKANLEVSWRSGFSYDSKRFNVKSDKKGLFKTPPIKHIGVNDHIEVFPTYPLSHAREIVKGPGLFSKNQDLIIKFDTTIKAYQDDYVKNAQDMTPEELKTKKPKNWDMPNYDNMNGRVHIKDPATKKRIDDIIKKDPNSKQAKDLKKNNNDGFRIRIDPADKVTKYQHIHKYDEYGRLLNKYGKVVDYKSPEGHIPYNKKVTFK
ncbi:hypothetical protein G7084_04470 [Weissella coleopterorum]|uniref:Uncharacterized protein n=1 Tax=Weissella coleopterorum TaxID=2714949 RepID=A0A6G8B078_9LACO|nr:hypothetical protein [Weissella coleopterorum]QIL50630.1 hypothetical protein G7084_04470 [Weissella coleopterorum]